MKYILFRQISVSREGKKNIYIRAVFNNLTAKIKLSPQTFFFIRKKPPKKTTLKLGGQPLLFLSPILSFPFAFSIFPFLVLFLEDFQGHFAFDFWSFSQLKDCNFRSVYFQISIKILILWLFTVTYTLILVNLSTSSNMQVSFFLKLFVFFLLNVNRRGAEDSFTNSLPCTTMQSF